MTRVLVVLVSILAMASCAKHEAGGVEPGGQSPGAKAASVNRFLAYEHTIGLETEEGKVATLFEADAVLTLRTRVEGNSYSRGVA